MRVDYHRVLDIVGRVYACAMQSEDGRLDPVLDEVAAITGSCFAILQITDLKTRQLLDAHHSGLPEEMIAAYQEEFLQIDPRIAYGARVPAGQILTDPDFITEREIDRSAYYMDFMRRFDLRYFGGLCLGDAADGIQVSYNVQRSPGQGVLDGADRAVFALMGRHLSNAITAARLLDRTRAENRGLLDALDASVQAIALVDRSERVVFANRALQELARTAEGWRLSEKGFTIVQPAGQARFSRLLAAAAQTTMGAGHAAGGRVSVPRIDGGRPYVFTVTPTARATFDLRRRAGSAAAIVTVVDPGRRASVPLDILSGVFQLSPAELRVAVGLTGANTMAELAQFLGVGTETVRTQLRRAMEKTGTSSQGELMALIERLTLAGEIDPGG